MPNWTTNRIHAEGSPAQISEFLEAIRGENGVLDFHRIIPMPELLKRTASGGRIIDGQYVSEWYVIEHADYANGKPEKVRLFTAEEEAELENLGHRSWYGWSIANWGTKWNACDPEIEDEDSPQWGYAAITFRTAWDAPEPVFHRLAAMFPFLSLTCEWRHEDESEFPHRLGFAPKETAGAA
jgi:hypothetical protein